MPSLTRPPAPHRLPREVISAKEKSKYKFPPAALPAEFGAFFAGQAPPLPCLAPPPSLSSCLQFPPPDAGQDQLSLGCSGAGELCLFEGFGAERREGRAWER